MSNNKIMLNNEVLSNHVSLGSPEFIHRNKQVPRDSALMGKALECARTLLPAPGVKSSAYFLLHIEMLRRDLDLTLATSNERLIVKNADLLRSELAALREPGETLKRTTHVWSQDHEATPRVLVIAQDLLAALNYTFDESRFKAYLRTFQKAVVLPFAELWEMIPAIKFVLIERIASLALDKSGDDRKSDAEITACICSLREVGQALWSELLESLIVFDKVLRRDPAGAYASMDAESRAMYRQAVVRLAQYSDNSEVEIAEIAVSLSQQSFRHHEANSRLALRRSHVGYYLLAEGRELLYKRAHVRLPLRDRLQEFLRRHASMFYLTGVTAGTLCMVGALLWWVHFSSPWGALFAALALLIPCSQGAVEIMNYLATSLVQPQTLPKLDFQSGVPEDCATMIVVPTLLLHEKQVRQLVKKLEVRYVANMGANLHFVLLTDLADSTEQPCHDDPLVDLCGKLIRDLNRKYGEKNASFSIFHRDRFYNPREGVWMGWERKRGKLLEFNKLILGAQDSFPYKVADLSVLARIRYVLTLDADTELPSGSVRRMIGTLAHPLNQPIIDNKRNIVSHGYGILQPRVDISVESAAKSRFASIYSGWTGLDIYTRAVSDVYQDLYGEGTFVGKGLYEVRTFQQVLDGRFPSNTILSHDLLEGAHARTGLVSDIQVVDHYPSRYAAYARRKHRWVRGDWQIAEWLLSHVPDESGKRVPNPISFVSRWKILDNLRRSVVEPVTFALFLLAWTLFPAQPLYWTLALLAILVVPTAFQLAVELTRAVIRGSHSAAKQAISAAAAGLSGGLLNLAFLLHCALISVDAILSSLYRRLISRKHLLEWETAAQAEAGRDKSTRLDLYLNCAPIIALAIAAALCFRHFVWVALPFVILWACSKPISLWLDRPPHSARKSTSCEDELFIRRAALHTWRYFAEFSNKEQNWLVPDNVQERAGQVANRISPTNLGFLLNARQIACELGHLTVPEFVSLTRRTFNTMTSMYWYRGHLLAWHDTQTLSPLAPFFVSTVDSGNLAASFITLSKGSEAALERPLLSANLLQGYDDHLLALADLGVLSDRELKQSLHEKQNLSFVQRLSAAISDSSTYEHLCSGHAGAEWFAAQLEARRDALRDLICKYIPWLLPEYQSLLRSAGFDSVDASLEIPLELLPGFVVELKAKLRNIAAEWHSSGQHRQKCDCLLDHLADAHEHLSSLVQALHSIADDAGRWFDEMDFSFLLDSRRKMLSIGYYVDSEKLHDACYDLLASEARMATFISLAKGDIPNDVWFRLGRTHVATQCGPTLASWSGSMFEYLMPAIWMNSYKETLLQNSMQRAVQAQKAYADEMKIPWGISESGYSELAGDGEYHYRAFGLPELAMQTGEEHRLVIAPYATAIALAVDSSAAVNNLRAMSARGWFGKYGFYEAADFGLSDSCQRSQPELVRSWMAHHQGMSLLSMGNFLCGDVVRRWFHRDVHVQATEMFLQERMVLSHVKRARQIKLIAPSLRIRAEFREAA